MRYVFLTIGVACLFIFCLVIILPHFIRFADRPMHQECVTNLKYLFAALRTDNHTTPGSELTVSQIHFSPERGNRYNYFMGVGPMEDRSSADPQGSEVARGIGADTYWRSTFRVYTLADLPRELASQVGVTGTELNRDFVVACAGQLGNPPSGAPDVWSVASHTRIIHGETIEVGEPYHHVDER